jgi:hypothetical protein
MTKLTKKNTLKRYFLSFFCLISFLLIPILGKAQNSPPEKIVIDQDRTWIGYMTTTRVSKKFSIWNDFHFVRQTFTVFRTGLMLHLSDNTTFTGGYGYLILPIEVNKNWLLRGEHRPWLQLQTSVPISKRFQLSNRIRYEYRNVQKVADGALSEDYNSYHRLRYQISFRYKFNKKIKEGTPFINIFDEVLLNFGENIIYNHLDQNRITFTAGIQFKQVTFQTGYMHRFVQQSAGNRFLKNDMFLLWITHTIDLRKKQVTNQ